MTDEGEDWPGARWLGASWIEFYGGPWDSTMVEYKATPLPLAYLGKITAWPKGTTPAAMRDGTVQPLGEYRPSEWADEELKIVKFAWQRIDASK
jgi:hypothetical protein